MLMHDSGDEAAPVLSVIHDGVDVPSMAWPLTQEEQMRLLQLQLQQQQQLLDQLQQRQLQQPLAQEDGGFEARAEGGRRAARRAATAKQRAQVAELEDRLQGVGAVHCQLMAENGMLRRRLRLLESGVQMREAHLEGLVRGRQQRRHQDQQQQQQQQGAATQGEQQHGGDGGKALGGLDECPDPGGAHHAEPSSSQQPQPWPTPTRWHSFTQFPDPKSWSTATCTAVKALTPRDYQQLWTEFVREASLLALSAEAHGTDTPAHQRLVQVT